MFKKNKKQNVNKLAIYHYVYEVYLDAYISYIVKFTNNIVTYNKQS